MKGFFLTVATLVCLTELAAQISNVPGLNNEVIRVRKYTDIDGSPYLYTDWRPGTVTDSSEKQYNNELIKYDVYKDVVEVNKDGQTMILNNTLYTRFSIVFADANSNKIVKHNFRSGFDKVESYSKESYFEVLSEKRVTLLKKYLVKFIDEVVNTYGSAAQVKKFQRSEKYFLIKDNFSVEIKPNLKSVVRALGEDSRLENYILKEKIKIKNEADLVRIVEYYQNLP